MNEPDLAKKIKQHLDFGLTQLQGETLSRLQSARKEALSAYKPAYRSVSGLALAGGNGRRDGAYQPFYRAWVPLAALIFGLLLVNYWQTYQQPLDDQAEIDTLLLAEDLPVHAYLDDGFDAWLEDTAQQ
jgi:hypothetical protein